MSRPIHKLTAKQVQHARQPGYYSDGGGLYLAVGSTPGSASWVFRYTLGGRKREQGLGSAATFSLAEARERARDKRKLLADGVDPIGERRAAQAVSDRTWGEAVADFIEARKPEWKSPKQAPQWLATLTAYGPDAKIAVGMIDTALVVALLRKGWTTKTETFTRLRGMIERIWNAEKVNKNVHGENPARWKGHLEVLLPAPGKVAKTKHHDAMPYTELPDFICDLHDGDSLTRKAMEFTILTAARTKEVTDASWAEFDLAKKLWTIPGARMKGGKPHTVPLCPRAVELLMARPRNVPPFKTTGMLNLLQKSAPKGFGLPYTVHGFRASFKTWADEETEFDSTVVEMALAHTVGNQVEAAYRRGAMLEKRRELMRAWCEYLNGGK